MTNWWLDERAYAGPEHLEDAYVALYERKAGYDPSADVQRLRDLGIGAGSVVVDLGAGTGAFTAAMAPHCGQVIALDVSPAMTEALRSRVIRDALDNVRVVEAGFLSYEHEGPPADAVFTRNALHHLPDFWKVIALARIAELLRPEGVLLLHDLVFDVDPSAVPALVDAWMGSARDDSREGYTATEYATHLRTEFSTYSWLFDEMLEHAGLTVVERTYRGQVYAEYTARKC